jgi:hypothetical protein
MPMTASRAIQAVVDLPEQIPLEAQVLMFWLVVLMWKRGEEAAVTAAI